MIRGTECPCKPTAPLGTPPLYNARSASSSPQTRAEAAKAQAHVWDLRSGTPHTPICRVAGARRRHLLWDRLRVGWRDSAGDVARRCIMLLPATPSCNYSKWTTGVCRLAPCRSNSRRAARAQLHRGKPEPKSCTRLDSACMTDDASSNPHETDTATSIATPAVPRQRPCAKYINKVLEKTRDMSIISDTITSRSQLRQEQPGTRMQMPGGIGRSLSRSCASQ